MIKKDSAGNSYVDIGEWTRITLIPAFARAEVKDWAGCTVLRVQSYRDAKQSALHMGAEIPVPGSADIMGLVIGILELCKAFHTKITIPLDKKD